MSGIDWPSGSDPQAVVDMLDYVQTPQCLICGRFVATSTFHHLGMDMNGEYTYRWTCSLCGLRVGS